MIATGPCRRKARGIGEGSRAVCPPAMRSTRPACQLSSRMCPPARMASSPSHQHLILAHNGLFTSSSTAPALPLFPSSVSLFLPGFCTGLTRPVRQCRNIISPVSTSMASTTAKALHTHALCAYQFAPALKAPFPQRCPRPPPRRPPREPVSKGPAVSENRSMMSTWSCGPHILKLITSYTRLCVNDSSSWPTSPLMSSRRLFGKLHHGHAEVLGRHIAGNADARGPMVSIF